MESFTKQISIFTTKLIIVLIILSLALISQVRDKTDIDKVTLTNINNEFQSTQLALIGELGRKPPQKIERNNNALFVIDFIGDRNANAVSNLSKEISAILSVAQSNDSVLIKIETGGGVVNGYGLGMAQIERLKRQDINVIVAVDKVAASGGYLMAVIADKIIAAPFAYIGSIGVVASYPNFSDAMKRLGIEVEEYTAGESKRSVGMFKENTSADVELLDKQLTRIHSAFKNVVNKQRPETIKHNIATGDFWLASDAINLGLIDNLQTSDEFIQNSIHNGVNVINVRYFEEKNAINTLISSSLSTLASLIYKSDLFYM